MKKHSALAAMSALVMVSGSVLAADDQSSWTGFNAGISAGSHRTQGRSIDISGSPLILVSQPASVPYSISVDRDESIGGLLVGYNRSSGALIYGFEADYTFNDLKGKNRISKLAGAVVTTASASVENLMTFRGRLGFAPANQWLLAITGGLAAGDAKVRNNIDEFSGVGRQFNGSSSKNKIGWALGVEAGYAMTKNLMVRADYTHYDLGKSGSRRGYQTQPALATQYADYSSIRMDGDLLRVSLLYKF